MSTKTSTPIPPIIIKTSTKYEAVAYSLEYAEKKLHEIFSAKVLPGYVEILHVPSISTSSIKPLAIAVLHSTPKRTEEDFYRISTPASTSSKIYSKSDAEKFLYTKILAVYKKAKKKD